MDQAHTPTWHANCRQAPFGNEDDLCDDDVDAIHLAENLDEMVCDAFGFEEYTGSEFKKLEQLLKYMKMPLYPGSNERYTKLSSLKLLQLKAKNHWTNKGFRAVLEVLIDMLPEGNEIPRTTYEAKKIVCPMGLKFEKIMLARMTASCSMVTMQPSLNTPSVGLLVTSEELTRVMTVWRHVVEFLGRLFGTSL